MQPVILISALLLGFAGSFHCLGMCGPVALSVSGRAGSAFGNRMWHYVLYFSGKTLTYGLLGVIFGLAGQGLVIAGMQQTLSVVMGLVMLLLVVGSLFQFRWFHQNRVGQWLQNKLIPAFGWLLNRPGTFMPFFLGMLNGLLPCGLVYIGLTAAVATGAAINSGLFMLVFGAGTIPVMLAFLVFTGQLSFSFRQKLRPVAPILMAVVGTILIMRGLNLGIPFISPVLDALMLGGGAPSNAVGCHP